MNSSNSNGSNIENHSTRWLIDPRAQGRYLLGEWRLMFRRETMLADAMAAIAVALVALPLSLAIANASGVKPEIGLVTAIVGGIVVALLGGCRLQVSGPAAAMTFLVYEIIEKYGAGGLIVATLLAGIFQLATGTCRLGRIMQFMPRPVVAGFLSGIGLTILCTQLPKVLGYDVTHDEEGGALGLLIQTVKGIQLTDPRALIVGLVAAGLMITLPKISRKIPTPLIAVLAATLLPWALGWSTGASGIKLLGALPRSFPAPKIPLVPWNEINELFMAAITIYVLASIESLLSAAVVDTMSRETRVDHDQELVGQGLGNIASALFGGIPVTGVIARSGTNIQAGARTRLAAALHAVLILVMMLSLAELVGQIPIAALAGVLIAVAVRMVEIRLLGVLWKGNKPEAAVFVVTTLTILLTDLIVGVPVGMVAAFLYVVYEMSSLKVRPVPLANPHDHGSADTPSLGAVKLLEVEGPLFFGSSFHLRNILKRIEDDVRVAVLDLDRVPFLDITGAELLSEAIELFNQKKVSVIIARPTLSVKRRLANLSGHMRSVLQTCSFADDIPDALAQAQALATKPTAEHAVAVS